jgi:hypothetical protein
MHWRLGYAATGEAEDSCRQDKRPMRPLENREHGDRSTISVPPLRQNELILTSLSDFLPGAPEIG